MSRCGDSVKVTKAGQTFAKVLDQFANITNQADLAGT